MVMHGIYRKAQLNNSTIKWGAWWLWRSVLQSIYSTANHGPPACSCPGTSAPPTPVVNIALAKASTAFDRLRSSVWEQKEISLTTKLKVYRAVVLSDLLTLLKLRQSTSNMPRSWSNSTSAASTNCWKWSGRIYRHTDILERTNKPIIFTMLQKSQLIMTRYDNFQQISTKMHPVWRAENRWTEKKSFKNMLKASIKHTDIEPFSWEDLACSPFCNKGGLALRAAAHWKRAACKPRASSNQTTESAPDHLMCPFHQRHFQARIGHTRHLRTHASLS